MDTLTPIQQSSTDIQVGKILERLLLNTKETIEKHNQGIDDEVAQFLKGLVEDQHNAILNFLTNQSERFSKIFVLVFAEAVKETQLKNYVDHYSYELRGLNIRLWVILKPDEVSFEVSSKFYSVLSGLMQTEMFSRLNIDFSVFSIEEMDIPSSFDQLKAWMSSRDKHVAKIQDNFSFLRDCENFKLNDTHPCWAVVVRFYVCVHIVEAILAGVNVNSRDHMERRQNIQKNGNLFDAEFQANYSYLYDSSVIARYNGKTKLNPNRVSSVIQSFAFIEKYAKEKHGITVQDPTQQLPL